MLIGLSPPADDRQYIFVDIYLNRLALRSCRPVDLSPAEYNKFPVHVAIFERGGILEVHPVAKIQKLPIVYGFSV
jgi:hypothetical protein